jgi:hypothetical protein
MQSPTSGLFSYSTRLVDDMPVNNFDSSVCPRYTINVLAGLQRAPRELLGPLNIAAEIGHFDALESIGDQGLLLSVLASAACEHDCLRRSLLRVAASRDALCRSNLQELCWLLIGLVRQAGMQSDDEAAKAATAVFTLIEREYMNHDTLLPYHSLSRARRRFVSFGGIAYFLMALSEYTLLTGNSYADTLFREATRVVLELQGDCGDWAWFYDAERGRIVDWYATYTVHQAAMAPLFLLPAVDANIAGASQAIERGYRWIFGGNELGTTMIQADPFFTFRSIRRRGPATRGRRYARGVASFIPMMAGRRAPRSLLRVNPECRSYEIGWLVYSWADRSDFSEFRSLTVPDGSTTAGRDVVSTSR